MPAYLLANVEVHDPEAYKEYTSQVPATLAPFGGRFVVRGGGVNVLEGELTPHRLVLIEFPDQESAQGWYDSPAYQAILPIRQRYSTSHFTAILDSGAAG